MTESQRFLTLNARVVAWAEEKGILAAGDELAQLGKTLEECREFLDAVRSGDVEQIKLEMGDVIVTVCVRMKIHRRNWRYVVEELDECPLRLELDKLDYFITAAASLRPANVTIYGMAIAAHYGFTVCDALEAALDKIEKRSGKMVGGVWVKEGA